MSPGRAALLIGSWLVVALLARDCRGKPPPDPAAGPRTDEMIAELHAAGWVVQEAEEHGNLLWELTYLTEDTTELHAKVRELVHQVELAGAEVRAYAELEAQAESSLRLAGEEHADTLHRLVRDSLVYAGFPRADSITAAFDDGVFSGRVAFFPRPPTFGLRMRARISAALAITEAPDGRLLFAAIPSDPRVTLSLDRALYQPPEPVQVCSWGERGRWALGGATLTAVATAVLGR